MDVRFLRKLIRATRGFLTIPGLISLSGLLVAAAALHVESYLRAEYPGAVPGWIVVSPETARSIFTTSASASISALVMVYSIVLLVYTMAASAIGPRLLQRFSDDRINQIAVGSLGATFLYALSSDWMSPPGIDRDITVAVSLVSSVISVLLLLLFVQRVSARATIDREAAEISWTLENQIARALQKSTPICSDDLTLPEGPKRRIYARREGYVDTIEPKQLLKPAKATDATVIYDVCPGDFVIEGTPIATVFNDPDGTLDGHVAEAAPLLDVRTPEGDLRFSVNLLVEIALRALSPGVNDTFTAIACVDHLSAALATARSKSLSLGVYLDSDGAVRVASPTITADTLFLEAFPPLRRAARNNGLMVAALHRAIARMIATADKGNRQTMLDELELLVAEIEAGDQLPTDRKRLTTLINETLESERDRAAG